MGISIFCHAKLSDSVKTVIASLTKEWPDYNKSSFLYRLLLNSKVTWCSRAHMDCAEFDRLKDSEDCNVLNVMPRIGNFSLEVDMPDIGQLSIKGTVTRADLAVYDSGSAGPMPDGPITLVHIWDMFPTGGQPCHSDSEVEK